MQNCKISISINTILRKVYYLIVLVPLWKILGFNFFIFHLFSFLMFLKLFLIPQKIKIPVAILPLFLFVITYVFSILVNLYDISLSRLLATLFNFSFWLIGLILILTIFTTVSNFKDLFLLLKGISILGVFSGVLAVVGLMLWLGGWRNLELPSVLFILLPDSMKNLLSSAPILQLYLNISIVSTDWFLKIPIFRTAGIEIYPTALGGVMLATIPLSVCYYKLIRLSKVKIFILVFLQSIGLIFSLSRITLLGIIFGYFVVYIIRNMRKKNFIFFVFVLFVILLPFFNKLPNIYEKFMYMRENSSRVRLLLYRFTFKEFLKNPILGYGYKPYKEYLSGIPIASHSSYLGVLYKTGVVGFCFFTSFLVLVVWQVVKIKKKIIFDRNLMLLWKYSGISFFSFLIWMITEDLDAPAVVSFLFFIVVSIILSLRKIYKVYDK